MGWTDRAIHRNAHSKCGQAACLSKNVAELFVGIEKDLNDRPDSGRLRDIRDWLDSPALVAELKSYIAGVNDPDVLNDVLARIQRLKRLLEDERNAREHQKDFLSRAGIGGGIGLVTGSLIAAAHATFPPIALISLGGGAWMLLIGYFRSKQLDQEQNLYKQLADRMTEIWGDIRNVQR